MRHRWAAALATLALVLGMAPLASAALAAPVAPADQTSVDAPEVSAAGTAAAVGSAASEDAGAVVEPAQPEAAASEAQSEVAPSEADGTQTQQVAPQSGLDPPAVAAAAAAELPLLTLAKTVAPATLQPGTTFTYKLNLGCNQESCQDAVLTDVLPAAFAGFPIVGSSVAFTGGGAAPVVAWNGDATRPAVVGRDTTLTVTPQQTVLGGTTGKGILVGHGVTITLTLQVPATVDPARNGEAIVNTADVDATNSAPATASAGVTLEVQQSVGVSATKQWTVGSQNNATVSAQPGATSTITMGVGSASNVPVDSLTVQEPKNAADGASALDASNAFLITDFTGFGSGSPASGLVTAPTGATSVTASYYVKGVDGTYSWVEAEQSSDPTRPGGVPAPFTDADVAGVRLAFAGEIAVGASASIDLALVQRETIRDTTTSIAAAGASVQNTLTGTVAKEGFPEQTKDASASHAISKVVPRATATKSITPGTVTAGGSATAIIGGSTPDTTATTLTISDRNFLQQGQYVFGGFTSAPTTPAVGEGCAAPTATITWVRFGGTTVTQPFGAGTSPALPAGWTNADVSGFDITWTAAPGCLAKGASSSLGFTITAPAGAAATTKTNTVNVATTTPYGPATANASSSLKVTPPSMSVGLTKAISPNNAPNALLPGGLATATLTPSISVADMRPTELVVEDSIETNPSFWNGFDLFAVSPTGVGAGQTVQVEVRLADGTWTTLTTQAGSGFVQFSHTDLTEALGIDPATLTGIRFTYTGNPLAAGSVTENVNLQFQARGDKRDGSGPTAVENGPAVEYKNTAKATGTATPTNGGDPVEKSATANNQSWIIVPGPGNGGGVGPQGHYIQVAKAWQKPLGTTAPALVAQSQDTAYTALQWRVTTGYSTVTLQDHESETDPAGTVFDYFDLQAVNSIGNSATAGSNGWALRWDEITAVEIFSGGAWKAPAACPVPASGNYVNLAVGANGVPTSASFAGCTLSAAERTSTTAVRLTVVPNLETRAAAAKASVAAPGVNDGVATTAGFRSFPLQWQLRNVTRTSAATAAPEFVVPDEVLNIPGKPSWIRNTVLMRADGAQAAASSDINLVKGVVAVDATKTVTPTGPITLPGGAATPVTFTTTATNTGTANLEYLQIVDPRACTVVAGVTTCGTSADVAGATGNPFAAMPAGGWLDPTNDDANAFDTFEISGATITPSNPSVIDAAASRVWVLRYLGGDAASASSYSSTPYSLTDFRAGAAGDLSSAIGIAVTLQGTNIATLGAPIKVGDRVTLSITTTLRDTTLSGSATALEPNATADVTNVAWAQGWNTLTNNGDKASDAAEATIQVRGGTIAVTPGKTITPAEILAVNRDVPVTVALTASSRNRTSGEESTLAPRQVWLRDDSQGAPEFWSTFELTGLGALTAPADADRVTIEVLVNGSWVAQTTPIADAAIPALPAGATLADVQGLRATFARADGAELASPAWTAAVPFTVAVRDAYVFPAAGTATVDDVVSVQSVRDPDNPAANSAVEDAGASIALKSGDFAIAVNKLAPSESRLVDVGQSLPWTLSFTNTGTGALTLTSLSDHLGDSDSSGAPTGTSHLSLGVEETEFATEPGTSGDASLATEGITQAYDPATRTVTWTWPDGGNVMQPGETFTVTVYIKLDGGLTTGQKAFNSMTVGTEQTLTGATGPNGEAIPACTNSDPDMQNNPNNGSFGTGTTCGTKDYVQPAASDSLFVEKAVHGYLGTAEVPGSGASCTASVEGPNGQSYFPSPCLSDTTYSTSSDVVDKWLLRTSNTTTQGVHTLVVFDDLPALGDTLLIGGASRGSDYRPTLTGAPVVHLPAGVTPISTTIEVTSSPNACQGTWEEIIKPGNEGLTPCEERGATWTTAGASTDWSSVTGLRVTIQFDPADPLAQGEGVDVTYETANVLQATPATSLASVVPIPVQEAWNQFGIQWRFGETNATPEQLQWSQRIPAQVGVRPQAGPLQLVKLLEGPSASYAPDSFTFQVTCSIPQPGSDTPVELVLPNDGVVTVSRNALGTGYNPVRIDGIPVGASCTVVETQAGGASSAVVTPGTVDITTAAAVTDPVPTEQVVTATNTFDAGALLVRKVVAGPAAEYGTGPFTMQVTCTFEGQDVPLPGDGVVNLGVDAGWEATLGGIPVGSLCAVEETDAAGATTSTVEPSSLTVQAGETTEVNAVTVTNTYEVGGLAILKSLAGAGAETYGDGPFTFQASCTFRGADVPLPDGGTVVLGLQPDGGYVWEHTLTDLVVGAECAVEEITPGGATSTTMYPEGGAVTVPPPADGLPSVALVSATNTFDTGELVVSKVVDGAGAEAFGSGPFEVQTVCTWLKDDGEPLVITLPNGGLVSFPLTGADGEPVWSLTYDDLIVGASCVVTETNAGGATSSVISPEGPVVIPPVSDGTPSSTLVTVTNTFDVGSLVVSKIVDGAGAELFGSGPFTVQAACTWVRHGVAVPIELPNGGTVSFPLAGADGEPLWSVTFDGLVVGASCVVTEPGTGGAATSTVSPEGPVVIPPVSQGEAQSALVTVTNTFDVTELVVTKQVVGTVAPGTTFTVQLSCDWVVNGVQTPLEIPGGGTRTITAGGSTTYQLPPGARCVLEETGRAGADRTSIAVTYLTGGESSASASIDLVVTGPTEAVITNEYLPPLPSTGAPLRAAMSVAAILLLGGGGVLLLSRRRRTNASE